MLRCLAALLLCLTAMPAAALCAGPSLFDRLSSQDRTDVIAAAAQTPFGEGLLWQATRGNTTITLIGTMHIYDPRLDAIHARVTDIVRTTDLLLVEATTNEERAMQQAMADDPDMILITDGPTLPELLGDATWAAVSEAARARQMPPFFVAQMRPWYLTLMLSIPPCAMPDMAAGQRGLDHLIMSDADAADVPMQALEPWETLLDLMQDGTQEEQIDMLKMSLLAPELQSEMFVAMLDSYFTGRIAELWETSRKSMDYVPGLDPAIATEMFDLMQVQLLTTRNANWLPVITQAAAQHDNIVVAVGAAHLPGDDGLLTLLMQDGWNIAPLY